MPGVEGQIVVERVAQLQHAQQTVVTLADEDVLGRHHPSLRHGGGIGIAAAFRQPFSPVGDPAQGTGAVHAVAGVEISPPRPAPYEIQYKSREYRR